MVKRLTSSLEMHRDMHTISGISPNGIHFRAQRERTVQTESIPTLWDTVGLSLLLGEDETIVKKGTKTDRKTKVTARKCQARS